MLKYWPFGTILFRVVEWSGLKEATAKKEEAMSTKRKGSQEVF
jgi:hypothetical protein